MLLIYIYFDRRHFAKQCLTCIIMMNIISCIYPPFASLDGGIR